MWRVLLTLPLLLLFVWASNSEDASPLECEEWEWVTATMNGRHIGNGHVGPAPIKVKQCKEWTTAE